MKCNNCNNEVVLTEDNIDVKVTELPNKEVKAEIEMMCNECGNTVASAFLGASEFVPFTKN